jgi:hypothetical protein
LWTTWLEVGCIQAELAAAVAAQLKIADSDDEAKGRLLRQELQHALVALCAFAFSLDGFYDVVRHEMGQHPDAQAWRRNRTARHAQISETLRFHFKTGPTFSRMLHTTIREVLKFRGRAVHPSSTFVASNYRPEIDSAVHPYFITFSGPHAVQCRALVLVLLSRLVDRARDVAPPNVDRGWLEKGRHELDRLDSTYRSPGDDALAFGDHIAPA